MGVGVGVGACVRAHVCVCVLVHAFVCVLWRMMMSKRSKTAG